MKYLSLQIHCIPKSLKKKVVIDCKTLVSKLDELLSLVSEDLSEKQLGSIRANINMDNEYILALESLSSILYEHKLSIPSRAYNLFQEVGEALSLKSEIWEILKPQVTD